jgi:SAM-dependent methyltransferase
MPPEDAVSGELEYHEALYSGFAQAHFAKPAVRAFRAHLVARILGVTGATPASRVLSLGCGLGDTELLLARAVRSVVGVDFSPAAIRQAREDARRASLDNVEFLNSDLAGLQFAEGSFDLVLAIFFLHHLGEDQLRFLLPRVLGWLVPDGLFYSLDPNRYRLLGAVGKVLVPGLMKRYHAPGERELVPSALRGQFIEAGFQADVRMYDFLSTPLAGLLPNARCSYRLTRSLDNLLVRLPLIRRLGSNFELIGRPRRFAPPLSLQSEESRSQR